MKGNLRWRLEALEAEAPVPSEGDEWVRRAIVRRIVLFIMEEQGGMRAPGRQWLDEQGKRHQEPSEATELREKGYTKEQIREVAVSRVFDNLEELLARSMFNDGVLLPYTDPEDLTPEGRERLREEALAAYRAFTEAAKARE